MMARYDEHGPTALMGPSMRVLCMTEKWESGGIEAFLTTLYEAMDLSDVRLDLVTCQYEPGIYDERLAALGLKVQVLSGSIKKWRENLAQFNAMLERGRYDVVHLNLYEGMALLFAREAKWAGVPKVIVHSHNTDLHPGLLRIPKLLVHRACVGLLGGYADARWAPSEAAARFLFGGRPWVQVKNGIQVERFAFDPAARGALRSQLGLGENVLAIGCVGRLCAQKNQSFLLRVLADMPDAVLVLAGEGEDEQRLRDEAGRLGVTGRVRFCGTLSDVAPLYSTFDVLAMPSLFEGLGIVAVEAQAAGLPVVASPAVPPEARVVEGLFEVTPLEEEAWGAYLAAARTCAAQRTGRSFVEDVCRKGYAMGRTAFFVKDVYEQLDGI